MNDKNHGLGVALEMIVGYVPDDAQAAVLDLAEALSWRTAIPAAATLPSVRTATTMVLGQMLEQVPIYRRHKAAFQALAVPAPQ